MLDDTVQSVHVYGEDVVVTKSFTYLGSIVHNKGVSYQEVTQLSGLVHAVVDMSIFSCRYVCRQTKIRIFKSLVLSVLLYDCETWKLNRRGVPSVFAGSWGIPDMWNQRLRDETESRPVTSSL